MTEPRTRLPEYTPEQLADAEQLAKTIAELPEEKQTVVTMMANAFISGMEAAANVKTA